MEILNTLLILGTLAGFGLYLSLAYAAEREPILWWVVTVGLVVLDGLFLLFGAAFAALPVLPGAADDLAATGLGGARLADALSSTGVLVLGLGLVGLLLLLPPIRRLVARVLPIDADRVVHTVALHYVLVLVAVAGLIAAVIPSFAADPVLLEELERTTADGGVLAAWVQALGFVVLSMLGVGLLTRRDWRETLARLGLTRQFSVRWWLGSVVLGLAGAFVTEWLWSWLQPESMAEVSRISDALFQTFIDAGLWGAITVGVSAGIGEEILFRGAAQPRLGLVFTALVFAVLHTQYTVSPALVQVFFIGLLLGLVRQRVNTTTAIGVHSTYNFVLVLLAIYAPELGP